MGIKHRFELVGYVVKGGRSCLFGRDWLGVIHLDWQSINAVHHKSKEKVQQLLEKYSTVFDGQMGTMKGFEAKLQVKEEGTDGTICFESCGGERATTIREPGNTGEGVK